MCKMKKTEIVSLKGTIVKVYHKEKWEQEDVY